MPKRSHNDEDSDYLRRKIRKIEKKLKKRRRSQRIIESSSSSDVDSLSPQRTIRHEDEMEVQSEVELIPMSSEDIEAGPSAISQAETALINVSQTESSTEIKATCPELDEEILNLLGDTPSKDKKFGPEIQHDLAVRLEHVATTGLTKESRKDLLEKRLIPKNCTKIDAPKLNPEIKAALSETLIKKDKALEQKQVQLAAAISCIGDALTRAFSSENKDQTIIKLLIEANRILCDSQHKESLTRRSFICSSIKKDIKDQLYDTEIDSFLFGEKLAETLKAAKAITKSGAEIKINTSVRRNTALPKPKQLSSQSLNQKPPLPMTARRVGAARRLDTAPAPAAPRSRPQQQPRQLPRSQQHHAQRR